MGAFFHNTHPLRISLLQLQVEANKTRIVLLHFIFEGISKESASKHGKVGDACAFMQGWKDSWAFRYIGIVKHKIIPPATKSALSLEQFESCPCRWIYWLVLPHLNYSLISCMAHLHYCAKCTVSKIQRLQMQPPWKKCTKLCLVSPHAYHTHFSHPLINLFQTGLVKRPLAVSFSSPSGTILWRADRYWWLLRQTPCQAHNTQSLIYNLPSTVSSQTTLHSGLVLHFYSYLRKVSAVTSGILCSWCLLWHPLCSNDKSSLKYLFLARVGRTCPTILLSNI